MSLTLLHIGHYVLKEVDRYLLYKIDREGKSKARWRTYHTSGDTPRHPLRESCIPLACFGTWLQSPLSSLARHCQSVLLAVLGAIP